MLFIKGRSPLSVFLATNVFRLISLRKIHPVIPYATSKPSVADLDNDIYGTIHGDPWSVTSWLGPSNIKFGL